MVLYCLYPFYKTPVFTNPKSDPNVTPQNAPDKTSLPNSPHRQNVTPQFAPQTKYHSPILDPPITPQITPNLPVDPPILQYTPSRPPK
uniref:Uncharacterized protein n=1 Tax=Meloidogyne enterolobii TaxID=390850 RepID=A0A6V7YD24_MELEN|nr:unnamed protein product [Meloidogyne enterolobii]